MKKTILFLLTIILTISLASGVAYADELIFKDDFGNFFTYDSSWSYYKNNLNDGYTTYEFENNNGEVLQLSYKQSIDEITKDDVVSMCNDSNQELVYKGSYFDAINGKIWFTTEYQKTVLCYYGTANDVLYRICISSSKTGKAYELARNIISGVSSSDGSSIDINDDALKTGIFDALITIILCLIVPYVIKKIADKIKSENSSVDNQCDNSNKIPMAWFKFTKYFRCPIMIIAEIMALSDLSGFIFTESKIFVAYLICVCCLISDVTFMAGTWGKKMQRYAFVAKICSLIFSCLLSFLFLINNNNNIFYFIGVIFFF